LKNKSCCIFNQFSGFAVGLKGNQIRQFNKENAPMGSVASTEGYTTSGYIGAAIVGTSITLSFKDFETSANASELHAFLTINGNLEKRPIDLGKLPQTSGAFDLSVPEGTDISLFNTVVLRDPESGETVGTASVP
jgi:hypothetical protein